MFEVSIMFEKQESELQKSLTEMFCIAEAMMEKIERNTETIKKLRKRIKELESGMRGSNSGCSEKP